ncbi:hypothetical protein [Isobaculum melis]|uniref:Uncharacterized protein n=1 Tax=Isobaculum melis TaxID=142588 RepID=A0A1H9S173_9LACT|nr:hypothetical protein [Isobaculum melis]SER78780.1 hypothetical protein SAMN04488559_10635 [Isobaculum melis]
MDFQYLSEVQNYLTAFCANHQLTIEQRINKNESGTALVATIFLLKYEIEVIVRGAYNTDYIVADTELLKEIYYHYVFYGESGRIHFSEEAIFAKWKKDFENMIALIRTTVI